MKLKTRITLSLFSMLTFLNSNYVLAKETPTKKFNIVIKNFHIENPHPDLKYVHVACGLENYDGSIESKKVFSRRISTPFKEKNIKLIIKTPKSLNSTNYDNTPDHINCWIIANNSSAVFAKYSNGVLPKGTPQYAAAKYNKCFPGLYGSGACGAIIKLKR